MKTFLILLASWVAVTVIVEVVFYKPRFDTVRVAISLALFLIMAFIYLGLTE